VADNHRARGARALPRDGWYRSRWFHLFLGLLVAVLAATWAGQRGAQGVLHNLDSRLSDAGAGADASLVSVEAEHLSALRGMLFTQDMPRALANADSAALNRLVTPLQANSGVPMVDVVRPNGQVIFAVRSKGAPAPVSSRAGLPALKQSLLEARGARGGRFTEVVIFKSGPTLLTIGPAMVGTNAVGAILVMTPLADILGRISQQVRADLSVYDTTGKPIATTAPLDPKGMSKVIAQTLIGGGATQYRYQHGDDREALGRLVVDHQPVAVLGVQLEDNSSATGRAVTLFAALGLVGTAIILATFWTRAAVRRRP
jgi:hypothetical protein